MNGVEDFTAFSVSLEVVNGLAFAEGFSSESEVSVAMAGSASENTRLNCFVLIKAMDRLNANERASCSVGEQPKFLL